MDATGANLVDELTHRLFAQAEKLLVYLLQRAAVIEAEDDDGIAAVFTVKRACTRGGQSAIRLLQVSAMANAICNTLLRLGLRAPVKI